ncbi:hypothetical protein Tco_0205584 [Tanacetum coccineum]
MNPQETQQVAACNEKTILDICPRVEGVDFVDVPDDDIALTFLIDLGYKGPLNRHTNMFVDHMHQPWRTLAAIINKETVDYPELIWEDLAYQIDHRKEKRSRCEDYQEYGLHIPDVMLTEAIKQSESYHMFIKYFTGLIPPKKSKGKGSKVKKAGDESQETVDLSEESEPEPAKKKTASIRVVKKKVTLSGADNIILDDPDAALELGKSISKIEAKEAEAARQVHATHSKPATSKTKLKGASSLTLAEQEAANIMQTLKESKKTSRRQPSTGGSNEGTGSKPGVLDESTVISAASSEGTSTKTGVPDEDKDITEEKVILEWGDEQDSEHSDDDNDDDEKDEKDGSNNGDEEITDAVKEETKKTSEAKDDTKKTELPPSSSSLSVSSGFDDQFLKLSSDSSLVSTIKDSADVDISSVGNTKSVGHFQVVIVLARS